MKTAFMKRLHLPLVADGCLQLPDNAEHRQTTVIVGSEAWCAWLADEQNGSFSFRNRAGAFTIRCEQKRQSRYWYAYRKHEGQLRKAYLGKSEEVTLERLNAVAMLLAGQKDSSKSPHRPPSSLAASLAAEKTHEPGRTARRSLPVPLTPLVGREQERVALCRLVRQPEVRLVTLTGTGGVGKTRLALQAAAELREDFAHGACFVPLAPVRDPEGVLATIAQALGLWGAPDLPLEEQVRDYLQEKHLLLLLDNFEQVIAAAPQLAHLLTSCSRLCLLVTSRAALHLSGEHEFAVVPLAVPDLTQLPTVADLTQVATVRLFVERAQAIQPAFELTAANARTIADICVRLDGLPLAIELAAARIKLLPPQALLKRLSHRLEVLTGGARDLPARQQTLRNTLQWSYDLLSAEEQRLFRWLSIFVGGFTLEAATAVCNAGSDQPLDVLTGVASLLDKSLLLQTEQEGEEPRFRMLETLREFGLACLSTNGEGAAAEWAHAWYYLALAEEAEPYLAGPELVTWLDRLERERENLRAVLQRATTGEDEEVQLALRLSNALLYLWIHRWYPSEGRSFLERGLARSQAIPAPLRLKALITDGLLMWIQNDARRLAPVAEEALALARALEDQGSLVYAFALQGIAIMDTRDYAAARSCFEEALALARAQGDRFLTAFVLMSLGRLAMYQREHQRAIVLFEESLPLYRAIGNPLFIAVVLSILSHAMLRQGELAQASVLLEEMLAICRKVRGKWGIAVAFSQLGQIAFQQGEMERAEALFAESLQLSQEMGDRRRMVRTRLLMAGLAARQGNYTLARAQYEESLTVAVEMGLAGFIASGLKGLGCVAAAQGQYTWSALLWGAAENRPESYSVAIPRTIYERMRATTRAHLGESVFVQNLAEGRAMTPEQALAAQKTLPTQTAHEAKSPPVVSPFPTKRAPAYPAGLTAREVEVLRLVAEGLTDAQVAEQLVISLRTVNAHLTSIYQKIHVSSRGAATRYALEHQLV